MARVPTQEPGYRCPPAACSTGATHHADWGAGDGAWRGQAWPGRSPLPLLPPLLFQDCRPGSPAAVLPLKQPLLRLWVRPSHRGAGRRPGGLWPSDQQRLLCALPGAHSIPTASRGSAPLCPRGGDGAWPGPSPEQSAYRPSCEMHPKTQALKTQLGPTLTNGWRRGRRRVRGRRPIIDGRKALRVEWAWERKLEEISRKCPVWF